MGATAPAPSESTLAPTFGGTYFSSTFAVPVASSLVATLAAPTESTLGTYFSPLAVANLSTGSTVSSDSPLAQAASDSPLANLASPTG